MEMYDLIKKRRSIRKFISKKIDRSLLERFVDAGRYAPSGSNLQPLKYIVVDEEEKAHGIFRCVKWAAYIAPYGNPSERERPDAFIIILADTEIRRTSYEHDAGAAAQNIMLTALEEGIGSCLLGAIDRDEIRRILKIPEQYIIDTVIALGYPVEYPVAEDENSSVKYYLGMDGSLHVPKRKLDDIILKL